MIDSATQWNADEEELAESGREAQGKKDNPTEERGTGTQGLVIEVGDEGDEKENNDEVGEVLVVIKTNCVIIFKCNIYISIHIYI